MSVPYYQDDLVTLYHGDCREVTEWLAADVLVTDPPYGMSHCRFSTNRPSMKGEVRVGRSSARSLGPEHTSTRDEALALWGARPAVVFGSWRAPRPASTQMRLVWDKEIKQGAGGVGPWRPGDEEIYLVGWANPKDAKRGAVRSSVLRHPSLRGAARPDHPTPKPVALMLDLIEHCPSGPLADPFAGSGATLLAARQLGRHAVGVEIEERYCELIATRLEASPALPALAGPVPAGLNEVADQARCPSSSVQHSHTAGRPSRTRESS